MKAELNVNKNLGSATQRKEKSTVNSNLTGTKEWAKSNYNFIDGCQNSCKYCYARAMAARNKRIKPDEWGNEKIREKALAKNFRKRVGNIMFPSTHDITPQHLPQSIQVLKKLLLPGNNVLVVSKPRLECIKALCSELEQYKKQILFRFTIGSADNAVLGFWEPNAPCFEERLECLKLAFAEGYHTSVSCEPMIDNNIKAVIDEVSPFVTDTIWLGKANRLKSQLALNGFKDNLTAEKANELLAWQSDENILALYERYKDNPLIRWKDSIQKVLAKNKGLIVNNQDVANSSVTVEDAFRLFEAKYKLKFQGMVNNLFFVSEHLKSYCKKNDVSLDWSLFDGQFIGRFQEYYSLTSVPRYLVIQQIIALQKFLHWCVVNRYSQGLPGWEAAA